MTNSWFNYTNRLIMSYWAIFWVTNGSHKPPSSFVSKTLFFFVGPWQPSIRTIWTTQRWQVSLHLTYDSRNLLKVLHRFSASDQWQLMICGDIHHFSATNLMQNNQRYIFSRSNFHQGWDSVLLYILDGEKKSADISTNLCYLVKLHKAF